MKQLRPQQISALNNTRASFGSPHTRVVLQGATGFGKTVIAANVIRGALAKGKRTAFVVDSISLIDQTVERFFEDGITEVGVIQADHPMTDWSKPVQIASVQTLRRRKFPDVDLVVVDECHERHETIWRWMDENPQLKFLGLSATPWSKGLGLKYQDLVVGATTAELIEAGYLCPFRTFAAAQPDVSGVKLRAGEYATGELAEIMAEGGLVADIVTTWLQYGEGRPTIAFCVDRAHAKKVQARFEAAGIGCGYIDAHTERADRKAVETELNAGRIKVVASVDCLTKGVDWSVGCIISARPTKSRIKWVQQVGRGLRVNPEAGPDCIILDHAGNTLRLGMVTDIHQDGLDMTEKGKGEVPAQPTPLPKECGKCGWLKPPKTRECPSCGFLPEVTSDIEEHGGELIEIGAKAKPKSKEASREEKQDWYSSLIAYGQSKGYKPGWAGNQYKQKFGVYPRGLTALPKAPSPIVLSYIRSRQIAFAKSKGKRQAVVA